MGWTEFWSNWNSWGVKKFGAGCVVIIDCWNVFGQQLLAKRKESRLFVASSDLQVIGNCVSELYSAPGST